MQALPPSPHSPHYRSPPPLPPIQISLIEDQVQALLLLPTLPTLQIFPSSLPPPAQISLMEDQVQALNAREIKACFLGSAQSSAQVGTGEGYAQGSCAVGKSAAG